MLDLRRRVEPLLERLLDPESKLWCWALLGSCAAVLQDFDQLRAIELRVRPLLAAGHGSMMVRARNLASFANWRTGLRHGRRDPQHAAGTARARRRRRPVHRPGQCVGAFATHGRAMPCPRCGPGARAPLATGDPLSAVSPLLLDDQHRAPEPGGGASRRGATRPARARSDAPRRRTAVARVGGCARGPGDVVQRRPRRGRGTDRGLTGGRPRGRTGIPRASPRCCCRRCCGSAATIAKAPARRCARRSNSRARAASCVACTSSMR